MEQISVISINPGRRTTGSFLEPTLRQDSTGTVPTEIRPSVRTAIEILGTQTTRKNSSILLLARILFGAMSVVIGIMNITGSPGLTYMPLPQGCSIVMIACGALMIPGLLTRIAIGTAFAMFAALGLVMTKEGMFPQMALMWGAVCSLLCIAGPGRYSLDGIIADKCMGTLAKKR